MRHTVHLYLDELAPALSAAAELLDSPSFRLESLQVSRASTLGKARLTAVVEAPAGSPGLEQLRRLGSARAARPSPGTASPRPDIVPYHWQADGAGDPRVG
jgi:hypothetical protein